MKKEAKFAVIAVGAMILGCVLFVLIRMLLDSQKPKPQPSEQPIVQKRREATKIDQIDISREEKRQSKRDIRDRVDSESDDNEAPSTPEKLDIFSEEFQQDDIRDEDMKVAVEIDDYEVLVGDEFDIAVRLSAPALESMTLLMEYDAELLECIADSAKAVGDTFRRGIEFYADNKKGRMVLINAGTPGAKNMEKAEDEMVATFKMVARKVGRTELVYPKVWSTFTNGKGMDIEDFRIHGGDILIEE